MSVRRILKREVRVALSRRAQPIWFRVVKWVVIVAVLVLIWRSPYFWHWVLGSVAVSLALHLVWRWKTHGWTRSWGGWNDTETAGPR